LDNEKCITFGVLPDHIS